MEKVLVDELRERVRALRNLANERVAEAARLDHRVLELEARVLQLQEFCDAAGICAQCGKKLEHFAGPHAGGVLCPECDHEHVAELRALNHDGERCDTWMHDSGEL